MALVTSHPSPSLFPHPLEKTGLKLLAAECREKYGKRGAQHWAQNRSDICYLLLNQVKAERFIYVSLGGLERGEGDGERESILSRLLAEHGH